MTPETSMIIQLQMHRKSRDIFVAKAIVSGRIVCYALVQKKLCRQTAEKPRFADCVTV